MISSTNKVYFWKQKSPCKITENVISMQITRLPLYKTHQTNTMSILQTPTLNAEKDKRNCKFITRQPTPRLVIISNHIKNWFLLMHQALYQSITTLTKTAYERKRQLQIICSFLVKEIMYSRIYLLIHCIERKRKTLEYSYEKHNIFACSYINH